LSWFLFGYIIDDIFVMIPNAIGVVLTVFQLFLIYIYGQHDHVSGIIASSHV